MPKIKLVYIDKEAWQKEIDIFYLRHGLTVDITQEYLIKNNLYNLDDDQEYITVTSKDLLLTALEKNNNKQNAILIDYNIDLDYIFNQLVPLIKNNKVNVYILNKSVQPIRSNVSMTIDLDKYDTDKEYEEIKELLESQLENSLKNAKKSNNPESATDLGVIVKEEDDQDSLFSLMLKEAFADDFEIDFDDYEELEEVPTFNLKSEIATMSYGDDKEGFVISRDKDELLITKDANTVIFKKQQLNKLLQMIEVIFSE